MAGVVYVNIFDQEPDMGVRQSFGGLSGAANRSAAPGVIGRRPARGFWRFPSAGDSNPGGVFHQDLRWTLYKNWLEAVRYIDLAISLLPYFFNVVF